MSDNLNLGGLPESQKDPAYGRLNQANYDDEGKLGVDRIRAIRAEAWNEFSGMSESDLWATFQMLNHRVDELRSLVETHHNRVPPSPKVVDFGEDVGFVSPPIREEVLHPRQNLLGLFNKRRKTKDMLIRKLWELNTVRQRLHVAHHRVAIRSTGWEDDSSGTNNTLREIAERILEVAGSDKAMPDSPDELLRKVDQLRGREERTTYRYLYGKELTQDSVGGWISWAEKKVEGADVM
jgi:hypothetical protein